MVLSVVERKRKSRGTARTRREKIAPALCAVGRLGEWDEDNLDAIDAAILTLAADWAAIIDPDVTRDPVDPVPRCTVAGESSAEESKKRCSHVRTR